MTIPDRAATVFATVTGIMITRWDQLPRMLMNDQTNHADPDFASTPLCDLEQAAPHAIALLCRVWGTPEVGRALRALMLNDRGHVRKWRAEVWAELILLRNLHQYLHPVPAPTAGALVDPGQFSVLEVNFPHVAVRLLKCWGNTEAFAVVHRNLVIDDRGNRAGWPEQVWDDLVLLQQVHDKVYGRLPEGAEPWKSFFLKD